MKPKKAAKTHHDYNQTTPNSAELVRVYTNTPKKPNTAVRLVDYQNNGVDERRIYENGMVFFRNRNNADRPHEHNVLSSWLPSILNCL